MKRDFFNRAEFRKYLLYALGETVLIVIGILIALQIDNWNTARIERENLQGHLRSIAGNIENDLLAARDIRSRRYDAYEACDRTIRTIFFKNSFSVAEILFAKYAYDKAHELLFFESNTSGYEALKSSGSLDRLHGTDIEKLLSDYYETVNRIRHAETSHNEYVRLLSLQMINQWPKELGYWEFDQADTLTTDRFQALQTTFRDLFNDNNMLSLLQRALAAGRIVGDYEELHRLGSAYTHMAANGKMSFDDEVHHILYAGHVPNSGRGFPNVIEDGQVAWHSYEVRMPNSSNLGIIGHSIVHSGDDIPRQPFDFRSLERVGDSLHIAYPGGADWAAVIFLVRGNSADRASLDFSGFDKLHLQIRGDTGGERISVHLKDRNDLDDGSQTNVELELSDEWQTFEIDLSDFETADTRELHTALGFLFLDEAQSFSVRNARFISAR